MVEYNEKEIHELNKVTPTEPRLIIFDDVTENEQMIRHSREIRQLMFNGRHTMTNIIMSTHSFTMIPPAIRNTVDIWMFPMLDSKYLIDYLKSVDVELTEEKLTLLKAYNTDIVKKRYNMLVFIKITQGERWFTLD